MTAVPTVIAKTANVNTVSLKQYNIYPHCHLAGHQAAYQVTFHTTDRQTIMEMTYRNGKRIKCLRMHPMNQRNVSRQLDTHQPSINHSTAVSTRQFTVDKTFDISLQTHSLAADTASAVSTVNTSDNAISNNSSR